MKLLFSKVCLVGGKGKKTTGKLKFSFTKYLLLLKYTLKPRYYRDFIVLKPLKRPKHKFFGPANVTALSFFVTNTILGSLAGFLTLMAYYKNISIIFLAVPETLILIPFTVAVLLVVVCGLHLIALLLNGKGDFPATMRATCLASAPLILLWVPFLRVPSLAVMLYVMTINFRNAHDFSLLKAVLNVTIVFIATFIFLMFLGIVGSLFLFDIR